MQDEKVATIHDWEDPENVKDVQSFLGFANFYRRFILNYSKVVAPMTRMTGKSTPWQWETEQRTAFKALKDAFTSAPILQHFDYEKAIVVKRMHPTTSPQGWCCSLMTMASSVLQHSSPRSTPQPNETMRSTTRNSWRSCDLLKNGDLT